MELRLLHAFVAVAEERHFRRAAERIFLSQPALSRQIQRLEADLQVQLLDRSGRDVALTPAGTAFLEEARRTLEQAERARLTAQRAARGEVGRLVIGFVGPAIYGVLPCILRAFRARHPDVELILREVPSHRQGASLHAGTLDVAFSASRPDGIATEAVAEEAVMIALPSAHRLAGASSLSLGALAEEPFVLFERAFEPALFDALTSLCRRAGFTPQVAHQANRISVILGLVAAGLGVAFAPGSVQGGLGTSEVCFVPLDDETPPLTLRMLWLPEPANPVLARFLDVARAAVHPDAA